MINYLHKKTLFKRIIIAAFAFIVSVAPLQPVFHIAYVSAEGDDGPPSLEEAAIIINSLNALFTDPVNNAQKIFNTLPNKTDDNNQETPPKQQQATSSQNENVIEAPEAPEMANPEAPSISTKNSAPVINQQSQINPSNTPQESEANNTESAQNTPAQPPTATIGGGSSSASNARDRVTDITGRIPRTLDELIEYRDQHFDNQAVTTGEATGTATSTTTDYPLEEEADITSVNNDIHADDSVISSTASSTDGTVLENEQYLDQENSIKGSAVSGNNEITSDKDVLEAQINTGKAGISASDQVKGNTASYQTIYGGGNEWTKKTFGSSSANGNSGDDNIVSGDVRSVRELSIINKNKAFVSNVRELIAISGRNSISARDRLKESGITTGKAQVKSSLLNIINTTTIDSAFAPLTFDLFDNFSGNINILELLFEAFGAGLDGPSTVSSAVNNTDTGDDSIVNGTAVTNDNLSVYDEKEGYIFNDLDLGAITGQNRITAGYKAKETKIKTDDALLTNNLINILNAHLFKSKVGVVVVNVFADWVGNLIVPDATMFAQSVTDPSGAHASATTNLTDTDDAINRALAIANSDLKLINKNVGGVDHEIVLDANTGNNNTLFDKDGKNVKINSGDIKAQSNLLTLANRNIVGAAFSQGFFNILGNWTGSVIGAQNARIVGSEKNFIVASEASALHKNSVSAAVNNTQDGTDDSLQNSEAQVSKSVTVNTKQEGIVTNRVNLLADTGSNDIIAYKGDKIDVETGNVKAANNIATFLNNTFSLSKGLIVALNVFGDWQGNVAYNEVQDLSVDVYSSADNIEVVPGTEITYTITATNSGTEPTPESEVSFSYNAAVLELLSSDNGTVSGSTITWYVPRLETTEQRTYHPVFRVRADLGNGRHTIETIGRVITHDSVERNDRDIHRITVAVNNEQTDGSSGNGGDETGNAGSEQNNTPNPSPTDPGNTPPTIDQTAPPTSGSNGSQNNSENNNNGGGPAIGGGTVHGYLEVSKSVSSTGPLVPGDQITYTVAVRNGGDTPVEDVIVYDAMQNEYIDIRDSWELERINAGETATIEYELTVHPEMNSADYTNIAYASGFGYENELIRSSNSSVTIVVENPALPRNISPQAPSSGGGSASSGSGGTVNSIAGGASTSTASGPAFGVINTFNNAEQAVLGTQDSVAEQEQLKSENKENHNVEKTLAQEISNTKRVNRYIPIAIPAQAAELPRSDQQKNGDAQLALLSSVGSVYPNFLHFSGMSNERPEPLTFINKVTTLTQTWAFWVLIMLIFIAAYISYKEKQEKFTSK